MIDNSKEYLICSAIRRLKPRECHKVYWSHLQDIYNIELGWRHPDILHRFIGEVSRSPEDQGFYTSKGRFVTREEGLKIARACGQVDKIIGGVLTSEDLYLMAFVEVDGNKYEMIPVIDIENLENDENE